MNVGTDPGTLLAGHPKLRNDLRRPTMEEIGYRTDIFTLGHRASFPLMRDWFNFFSVGLFHSKAAAIWTNWILSEPRCRRMICWHLRVSLKPQPEVTMRIAGFFLPHRLSATAAAAALTCLLSAPAVQAQQHTMLEDPIPGTIKPSPIKIALQPVLSGLVSPVVATTAPSDREHIYVADQVGQVWRVAVKHTRRNAGRQVELFLDVKALLVKLGLPPTNYDERGLLGLAFHPEFNTNGLFYTFTSQPVRGRADFSTLPPEVTPNCQSVITEWRVKRPGERDSAVDLSSARELVRIDKPQFNHNGGAMVFGPDHMLYVSLGDGGGADDQGPGHAPEGNGQNLAAGNVLGKILRIDPLGRNSANGKYGIPPDNPMIGTPAADEIFAYGFRNPFRMSFDPYGRLIVGDVGQNNIEEVDIVTAGGNYGWRIKEGSFLFDPDGMNSEQDPDVGKGFVYADSPGSPAGLIDPIAQYDHSDGPGLPETRIAVIGGFVYSGDDVKGLRGRYVFGDYSGEASTTPEGHLFTLGRNNEVEELVASNRHPLDLAVLGFGQDRQGELYLLANGTGTVSGKTGVVMRITGGRHHRDH
jgi:glucose/arabinose dehydrogenase